MALKLLSLVQRRPNTVRITSAPWPKRMTEVIRLTKTNLGQPAEEAFRLARTVLAYVFVWSCLVKIPATALRDSPPQSWEPVLSYAAAHHLQWGRDIVYTFG